MFVIEPKKNVSTSTLGVNLVYSAVGSSVRVSITSFLPAVMQIAVGGLGALFAWRY